MKYNYVQIIPTNALLKNLERRIKNMETVQIIPTNALLKNVNSEHGKE